MLPVVSCNVMLTVRSAVGAGSAQTVRLYRPVTELVTAL